MAWLDPYTYSVVGGGPLGQFMSPGERERRDRVRQERRRYARMERQRADEQNRKNHMRIGRTAYPFGGYDQRERIALKEAWDLLNETWPILSSDETRLANARRQFFSHCAEDDPQIFAETFFSEQDRWIDELYHGRIDELVALLKYYWPFGPREGLSFEHAYPLVLRGKRALDRRDRIDAAVRMLHTRPTSESVLAKLCAVAQRPIRDRDQLHCFAEHLRAKAMWWHRMPVRDCVVDAYQEAERFKHPKADRFVRKLITHAAHRAAQQAVGVREIDTIESLTGRKMPHAYREASAARFYAADAERREKEMDALLERTCGRLAGLGNELDRNLAWLQAWYAAQAKRAEQACK